MSLLKRLKMKKRMQIDDPSVVKIRAMPDCVINMGGLKYAIIKGVFPENLVRSLTTKTKHAAMAKRADEVIARSGTTVTAWAMVPMRYVITPENDLGEIAP